MRTKALQKMWSETSILKAALCFCVALGLSEKAHARPYEYPQLRYESGASQALGGITVPVVEDTSNYIFNNPAGLAKNEKLRVEAINLNLEANSATLSNLGTNSAKMSSLAGMKDVLNSHPGSVLGAGFSNATSLSWGGLGIGVLVDRRMKAVSDGTNIQYEDMNQLIPAVAYGVSLARGVIRLGYGLQYVNESYGTGTASASSNAPSYLSGINQGHALSQNASANISFPFRYSPTFSVIARNIGGLHYTSGSTLLGAQNTAGGTPPDESMAVDAAFNATFRISGTLKTNFYFQYTDVTDSVAMQYLDHLSAGFEVGASKALVIRAGTNGIRPSLGIGFRSESSEINLAWYHEQNPFTNFEQTETRYTLQYKLFFQASSRRSSKDIENKDSR
jgi:hypothetical protein